MASPSAYGLSNMSDGTGGYYPLPNVEFESKISLMNKYCEDVLSSDDVEKIIILMIFF